VFPRNASPSASQSRARRTWDALERYPPATSHARALPAQSHPRERGMARDAEARASANERHWDEPTEVYNDLILAPARARGDDG